MTPAALKNAVAVSGSKRTPNLGYITWSGFSDAEITLRTLKHHWQLAGLPAEVLPGGTKALASFKRAVASLEGHRGIDRVSDIHVDKVVETPTDCVYQVAFVIRDLEKQEASYPRACKFVFNKQTEKVSPAGMGEVPRAELLPLFSHVLDRFHDGLSRVHGSRVRKLVREYLTSDYDEKSGTVGLSGENMAEGNSAVYFVKAEHEQELRKLQSFVQSISQTQGYGFFNMIPVADGRETREMVRRHTVANVEEALAKAIAEARAELSKEDRKQALRSDRVANMFADYHMLLHHARQYEHILEDQMADVERKADILKAQLDRLL